MHENEIKGYLILPWNADTLQSFAVDRFHHQRQRWVPIGLFRAPDLDDAIEAAAFAIGRPAVLRATRLLL